MHYELPLLSVAHACPYHKQSSCSTFNVTETLYIWVTQNPHLHVESTSPYEGHTSCPTFLGLLHPTSRFFCNTSGIPKILHWIHLTPLVMLALLQMT